jgi:SAM-dependent methyltransferase
LSVVIDPERMFSSYPFRASTSKTWREHCDWIADFAGYPYALEGGLVLDIGANDGCLLEAFDRRGMKTLGIEPSQLAIDPDLAFRYDGIRGYFNASTAQAIRRFHGSANIVTATNVLAHVDDLHGFFEALDVVLEKGGTVILEVPHFEELVKHVQFDTIYHEHLSYFQLAPLELLLLEHGFYIVDALRTPVHGGSLAVRCARGAPISIHQLKETSTYRLGLELSGLADRVSKVKRDWEEVFQCFKKHKTIAAVGASAKGAVLLNYLDFKPLVVFDDNPDKQGRFMPGIGAAIVPFESIAGINPDCLMILSWNISAELRARARAMEFTGAFIILKDGSWSVDNLG